MSTSPTRLQIAARMHELLLAEIGFGIEVERLLTRERYARDVLLVCDACDGTDLPQLAAQFRRMTPAVPESVPAPAAAPPGHAAQATDWSRDTSGFGVTGPHPLPPATPAPAPASPGGWRAHLPWR